MEHIACMQLRSIVLMKGRQGYTMTMVMQVTYLPVVDTVAVYVLDKCLPKAAEGYTSCMSPNHGCGPSISLQKT